MTGLWPQINARSGKVRNQLHTTKLGEACHIRVCYDLGMLKTRSEGSHVDTLKCRLECVDDKSICSITNCMDILETAHDFWREGKM